MVVKVKEDIGSQDGRHDRANAIEGLGDVDSNFRILGRAADCDELGSDFEPWAFPRDNVEPTGDVRVGSCLERTQAVSDNENADTEASEGAVQDRRNGKQCAKAVQEEAPDEDGSIAVVAQDPGGVPKRSQGVGTGRSNTVSGDRDGGTLGAKTVGEGKGSGTHPK